MATPITVSFFTKLLLPILVISALFGGVERAFADDRKLFLIEITREGSKAVTTMHVRAEDIDEARSQVVLNGWILLKIEEKTEDGGVPKHKFRYSGPKKVGGGNDIQTASAGSTAADDKNGGQAGVTAPSTDIRDVLPNGSTALLADDNYTYVGSVYFDLGRFQTEATGELAGKAKATSLSGKYLILGHTDTVRVLDNNYFDTNFDLSRKRADFLKSILVRDGISAVNIATEGMGTLMPAVDNTDKGQPLNRRADLYERN